MADSSPEKVSAFALSGGKVVPLLKARRGRAEPLEPDALRLQAFLRKPWPQGQWPKVSRRRRRPA